MAAAERQRGRERERVRGRGEGHTLYSVKLVICLVWVGERG